VPAAQNVPKMISTPVANAVVVRELFRSLRIISIAFV